jgi:hypothetical protein
LAGLLVADPGQEVVEVAAGELPLEWLSDRAVMVLEGEQVLLELLETGEVVGGQSFSLEHREVDFDLIEPTAMDRGMDDDQIGPLFLESALAGFSTVG